MAQRIAVVSRCSRLSRCGSDELARQDAPSLEDAAADAPPDAPPDASCERTLLADGMTTGWTTRSQGPGSVSSGADYVQLETSTSGTTGGMLLLTYPGAVTQGTPFVLEVVALVEMVSPHNPLDASPAIMGSFTPPFGTTSERSQMIYLDADEIGWA